MASIHPSIHLSITHIHPSVYLKKEKREGKSSHPTPRSLPPHEPLSVSLPLPLPLPRTPRPPSTTHVGQFQRAPAARSTPPSSPRPVLPFPPAKFGIQAIHHSPWLARVLAATRDPPNPRTLTPASDGSGTGVDQIHGVNGGGAAGWARTEEDGAPLFFQVSEQHQDEELKHGHHDAPPQQQPDQQHLVFMRKQLDDVRILADHDIHKQCMLHFTLSLLGGDKGSCYLPKMEPSLLAPALIFRRHRLVSLLCLHVCSSGCLYTIRGTCTFHYQLQNLLAWILKNLHLQHIGILLRSQNLQKLFGCQKINKCRLLLKMDGWTSLQRRLVLGLVVVGSQLLGREAGKSGAHHCNLAVHLYCNLAVHLYYNPGCTLCTISSMVVHLYCNLVCTF